MNPDEPKRRPRRARDSVREEDIVRSTREVAARKGLRDEDIMMSSRERAALGGAPPDGRAPLAPDQRRRPPAPRGRRRVGPLEPEPLPLPEPLEPSPPAVAEVAIEADIRVAADVPWAEICELAFRFDPMQIAGSIDRAIALADRVRASFVVTRAFSVEPRELAACLAFECRTCHHCGVVPSGDDLGYLSALYTAVRARL